MIPGPRPWDGHERPPAGRDLGPEIARPLGQAPPPALTEDGGAAALPSVTLTRTGRGWTVVAPGGTATAGDLVEGLSLADVVAEEYGALVEPNRTTRRSARGPGQQCEPAEDSPEGRIAALQRTVAQLEHALAARVSTERAIGVLAERNRTSPREAFESLRRQARSSGRPVPDLAREVLAGLEQLEPAPRVPVVEPVTAALRPPGLPAVHPVPAAAADSRR